MDNTGHEDIMGLPGLGEKNEGGERFANLYTFNKLIIGSTIFLNKPMHKNTLFSLDQIGHIYVSKTFRITMKDVRTKRGADIVLYHCLMVTMI